MIYEIKIKKLVLYEKNQNVSEDKTLLNTLKKIGVHAKNFAKKIMYSQVQVIQEAVWTYYYGYIKKIKKTYDKQGLYCEIDTDDDDLLYMELDVPEEKTKEFEKTLYDMKIKDFMSTKKQEKQKKKLKENFEKNIKKKFFGVRYSLNKLREWFTRQIDKVFGMKLVELQGKYGISVEILSD